MDQAHQRKITAKSVQRIIDSDFCNIFVIYMYYIVAFGEITAIKRFSTIGEIYLVHIIVARLCQSAYCNISVKVQPFNIGMIFCKLLITL